MPAFLGTARALFPLLAVLWLGVLLLRKRPRWLLAGVVAANAFVWFVTNYPLQRIYALGPSQDRIGNLGFCQVVAAGRSPLETPQIGQLHFEPFWGLFVAALSGWNPDRVLALYPFLTLLVVCAFVLSLYWGLRSRDGTDASRWEAVVAAGFATLLSTSVMDFTGTYGAPWAAMFLLKPNHALGLVLFPVLLRAFAAIRGWRGRLAVGLFLQLLGWVFVLHMVYVCAGLVLYALLSWLSRRDGRREDVLDVLVVIGVNLLIVSPYLVMLFVGYPFLTPSPTMVILPRSPHLLEITARVLPIFLLGLRGLLVLWRRGDRLGRLWASQVLAALMIWVGYYGLGAIQMARESDEIHIWCRLLVAAGAGVGAWDLVGRAIGLLGWVPRDLVVRAVVVAVLALPWSLPYWWDPLRMDPYVPLSLHPLPRSLARIMDFLRRETDPRAVVVGDRSLVRYVPALGARRVLFSRHLHPPPDYRRRRQLEEALMRGSRGADWESLRIRYRVEYLLVTEELLALYPGVSLAAIEERPGLRRVLFFGNPRGNFVALFAIEPLTAGPS